MNNLVYLVLSVLVFSSDVVADDAVYESVCASCHGSDASGNTALGAPALAGQLSQYTSRQLQHYAEGLRQGDAYAAQMNAVVQQLDSSQMASLGQYLGMLDASEVNTTSRGSTKQGNTLYQSYCGSCHGVDGRGNAMLNAPNLRILDAAYLKRQYRLFVEGKRGVDKADKFGRQMSFMAKAMPEAEQIDAVVAYLHSLGAD